MLAGIKQELTDLKPRALNLQNALDTERKQREESYNQLLPRLDEKITFLDQTPQLVNHYGDLGAPQDDRVLNMTPNGITQDCSGIVLSAGLRLFQILAFVAAISGSIWAWTNGLFHSLRNFCSRFLFTRRCTLFSSSQISAHSL